MLDQRASKEHAAAQMSEKDNARGFGKEDSFRGYSRRAKRRRLKRAAFVAVLLAFVAAVTLSLRSHLYADPHRDGSETSVTAAVDASTTSGGGVAAASGAGQHQRIRQREGAREATGANVAAAPDEGTVVVGTSAIVGVKAEPFEVDQPRPCRLIGAERSDGEANAPVVQAFVDMRTRMRTGKILRGCSKAGNEPEELYRRLNAGVAFGPLCYFPEFLGGLASTLSVCSQNHQDGVLLALMAFARFKSREVVEISSRTGSEKNGAYFVHNHGFRGVFLDGDVENTRLCATHFSRRGIPAVSGVRPIVASDRPTGASERPANATAADDAAAAAAAAAAARAEDAAHPAAKCVSGSIAVETVSGHIADGFAAVLPSESGAAVGRREIDLLSLDVDGVDLYLLQPVLETVDPRVVVVEYRDIIGPVSALTVPFDVNFTGKPGEEGKNPDFAGASLAAFVKVLSRWGYHFVGCEGLGFDGFFIRADVIREGHLAGRGSVRVVTPPESRCFERREVQSGMEERWPEVKGERWVEVDDEWLATHAPGPKPGPFRA